MKPQANLLIGTLYDMGKIFKKYPWRKSTVYVHFHPLMKYEEYKDMNSQELSVVVKEIIQKKLDEFKNTV
jgi:1-acyl-sn-glycerol-3-phosphate acyltransferase